MINKVKFKDNLTKSLLSAVSYSRSVLDSIDKDYQDIEGRKFCSTLIADWEQTIRDIDEDMTKEYLGDASGVIRTVGDKIDATCNKK